MTVLENSEISEEAVVLIERARMQFNASELIQRAQRVGPKGVAVLDQLFSAAGTILALIETGVENETEERINTCQECSTPVEAGVVVCDKCYERRFGQPKRRDT